MEPNPERITWLTFMGWLVLALVIAMFAAPIALWVGAASQPTVIRIAVAIFCACIVQRLLALMRHATAVDQMPQADRATRPSVGSVTTDPLLTDLAKDLRWGGWYFVPPALWIRLQGLCHGRGIVLPPELMPKPNRRPTWAEAERVARFLEDGR
jgi:hypothetical protein